ncbi:unnamed protein product [Trichobilharzia regenti]|nr:unnamed protein product [Trichobilharzia regenti]
MRVLEFYSGIGGMHLAFQIVGAVEINDVATSVYAYNFPNTLVLNRVIEPQGIILENVKGFEHSEPWRRLIEVLNTSGYEYQQFLLSPLQFGIPNCRLRFYLVARLPSSSLSSQLKMGNSEFIDLKPPMDAPCLPGCMCTLCCDLVR